MLDPKRQWEFIVEIATEKGVGAEALRKWRKRGHVPHKWRLLFLDVAKARRIKLDPAIFDNVKEVA